jgi:hypothetical protein
MNCQIYLVTPCGHIKYLAGMREPDCPMCRDIESRCELVAGFIRANPALSIPQAVDYARRIREAEEREDYVRMHELIQEALYGNGGRNAA